MAKKFFEVFPTLKLDKNLQELFEQVSVERVSATKRKDFIRIYISCDRLIQKENILLVENRIKTSLFPKAELTVKIYEKYRLSSQYNPEKLMNTYKDSILMELREYDHIEYSTFKNASVTYPDEKRVVLTVEDSVLARSREEDLLRILEKIFNDRCGFSCIFMMEYKETEKKSRREEDEKKIAMQVAEITARANRSVAEEALEPAGERKEETKADSKTGGGKNTGGSRQSSSQGAAQGTVNAAQKPRRSFGEKQGGFDKGRGSFNRQTRKSDNPDVLYGRDFEEEAIAMEEIMGEMGEVVIRGKILNLDKREIRNEKTIVSFDITDFTDTMTVKMFTRNDQLEEILAGITKGAFVKIKGVTVIDKYDNELTIGSIVGVKKIPDFTTSRTDNSVKKRVELHCHTKMSDMDGVSEAKDIVKRAYKWGHPAIAITDHGVVQSFPDANHVWEDLWKAEKAKRKEAGEKEPDKQDFFKVIYGVEAYLVDGEESL